MDELQHYFGMDAYGAAAIVVSATLLYLSFTFILDRYGQRLLSSPSSFDLAVVTVIGAIIARAILGRVPTLGGALLALGTLLAIEQISGRVRRGRRRSQGPTHRAVAVMVRGRLEREVMRRHHVEEAAVWAALRQAGVCTPEEVALVVLEHNGRFSVLKRGEQIHASVLHGVRHSNELRERLAAG